jgi:cyclopropane-fatty-acyl-phospholipid synthase
MSVDRDAFLMGTAGSACVDAVPRPLQERAVQALRRRVASASVPAFDVQFAGGTVCRLPADDRQQTAPAFTLRVLSPDGATAVASLDELAIGEAYLRGDLDVDGDFLACLDLRPIFSDRHPLRALARFAWPFLRGQRRSDMTWIPRHYDCGNDFYFAFLDKWVGLYSQALYTADDEPLESAVRNKLEYIYEVCRLRPGCRILDVGAGWGALEKHIGAKGIDVTMMTLSHNQLAHLSDWSTRHGLPCQLNVVYESIYTFEPGTQFDAIVLLGVMEHLPAYRRLFARFARLLKPGARVYMDFTAQRKKYAANAFVYRHVFEGNHTPVYLPGLFKAAALEGFEPIALHNDRHSYFLTLQAWARNLEAARERVVPMVGERVYRLFRLYLWGCAHHLQRNGWLESYRVVFQRAAGRPSSEIGTYKPV